MDQAKRKELAHKAVEAAVAHEKKKARKKFRRKFVRPVVVGLALLAAGYMIGVHRKAIGAYLLGRELPEHRHIWC